MIYKEKTLRLMGTKIEIKLYANTESLADDLILYADDLLHKYNVRFNMYNSKSEISQINSFAGIKPIKVKKDLFELIKIGKVHSIEENSNLNIAIGPLVKLWNIGFSDARVPTDKEIESKLNLSNPHNIILDENELTVFLKIKGMVLDIGAIAKGYIADIVMEKLIDNGVKSAYINLGGNVLTFGLNFNNLDLNWRIGLQNPNLKRGNHLMILAINNMSMVTSGVYERNFESEGKIYHHILSPQNGSPIENNMKSITVISKKSVICDIWTSKLFGKNINEALKIANNNEYIEIIIVDKLNNIYYSDGIEKYIIWKEKV